MQSAVRQTEQLMKALVLGGNDFFKKNRDNSMQSKCSPYFQIIQDDSGAEQLLDNPYEMR